jgi:hypothetical protein
MRTWKVATALMSATAGLAAFGLGGASAAAGLTTVSPIVSASGSQAALVAASGAEEPASAIPWGSVGPGWFVALWVPHAPFAGVPPPRNWQRQASTLYLVDPLGGRYRVAVLPPPSYYRLYDWAGDGRRVLIGAPAAGSQQRSEIEDIDLGTGMVVHHFVGPNSISWYQYTRPEGLAILASAQSVGQSAPGSVVRLSLSGATQQIYPTAFPGVGTLAPDFSGGVLPSLDGTALVMESTKGMALVANDGTFIRDVGPRGQGCSPQRWWGPTEVVASCQPIAGNGEPALWLVPTTGQAAYQLTYPKPPDLGDMDGWKVGTAVYTQAAGPCGTEFLARRQANGATTAVSVPHAKLDVHVVGAQGSRLALQAMLGCGTGPVLFWFDPGTTAETPLLGTPLNGGSVLAVLPYPGLQS